MRQTNNAIKFLLAQYRAIYKSAFVLGLATAATLSLGMASAQAIEFTGDIELSGEEGAQYGSYSINGGESVPAAPSDDATVRVESESDSDEPSQTTTYTGNYGIYLNGEHTLNNANFTVKTDDHAGYGARVGFEGGTFTILGNNNISQMLTLDGGKNTFVGGGNLNITGYLTISPGGVNSDLSGANFFIKSGQVGVEEEQTAGALILGYDITAGNMTFEDGTKLKLYGTDENHDKTITVNNRTILFNGTNSITNSPEDSETPNNLIFAKGNKGCR